MAAVLPHVRGRLLDIGCGSNLLVKQYGNGVGVDVHAWEGVDLVVQDTAALPFDSRSFTTITIVAALNHIPNRDAVLREAHRLLADEGRLIITMIPPFISSVWHRLRAPWDADQRRRGMQPGEVYGMTFEQIDSVCAQAEFALERRAKFMLGINTVYLYRKRP